MDINILWLILFAGLAAWNKYAAYQWKKKFEDKEAEYKKILGQKKSSEVRLGQISEHLAPFLSGFKYNSKRAHFLGQPIDYIVFEDDKIVFLEIKSGKAQLSSTQKDIKQLIKDKKVEWDEMRIDTPGVSLDSATNTTLANAEEISRGPEDKSSNIPASVDANQGIWH